MKIINLPATILTAVNIFFLSGCDSPPWISENHEEDFGQVFSRGLDTQSSATGFEQVNQMCKQLGHYAGHKAEFSQFDLVNNTIEKNKSTMNGTPVNIKKAQFNGNVNLYCWDINFSNPNSDYSNIVAGGDVAIYQEVSEVGGETFKGEWQLGSMNIVINEH